MILKGDASNLSLSIVIVNWVRGSFHIYVDLISVLLVHLKSFRLTLEHNLDVTELIQKFSQTILIVLVMIMRVGMVCLLSSTIFYFSCFIWIFVLLCGVMVF